VTKTILLTQATKKKRGEITAGGAVGRPWKKDRREGGQKKSQFKTDEKRSKSKAQNEGDDTEKQ